MGPQHLHHGRGGGVGGGGLGGWGEGEMLTDSSIAEHQYEAPRQCLMQAASLVMLDNRSHIATPEQIHQLPITASGSAWRYLLDDKAFKHELAVGTLQQATLHAVSSC